MGKPKYRKKACRHVTSEKEDRGEVKKFCTVPLFKEGKIGRCLHQRRFALTPLDTITKKLSEKVFSRKQRKYALESCSVKPARKIGVLGNRGSLEDALPSAGESNVREKPRVSKPMKVQAKEMMEDINTYREIIQNLDFSRDPFGAVVANLQRLQLSQQKMVS